MSRKRRWWVCENCHRRGPYPKPDRCPRCQSTEVVSDE